MKNSLRFNKMQVLIPPYYHIVQVSKPLPSEAPWSTIRVVVTIQTSPYVERRFKD